MTLRAKFPGKTLQHCIQNWWFPITTPAHVKQKQEDGQKSAAYPGLHSELQASLSYMEDLVSNPQIILSRCGSLTPNVFTMRNLRVFLGISHQVSTEH